MIRDFARAVVLVLVFLVIVAEIQGIDEAASAQIESAPAVRATQTDF